MSPAPVERWSTASWSAPAPVIGAGPNVGRSDRCSRPSPASVPSTTPWPKVLDSAPGSAPIPASGSPVPSTWPRTTTSSEAGATTTSPGRKVLDPRAVKTNVRPSRDCAVASGALGSMSGSLQVVASGGSWPGCRAHHDGCRADTARRSEPSRSGDLLDDADLHRLERAALARGARGGAISTPRLPAQALDVRPVLDAVAGGGIAGDGDLDGLERQRATGGADDAGRGGPRLPAERRDVA